MMKFLLPVLILLSITSFSQDKPVGVFQNAADVGKPKLAGSSRFDKAANQYVLKGGGYNIWFDRDEFHYLYNKIKGDFTLTANFRFAGKGKEGHRKTGWMIRYSLEDNAAHASAVVHGDSLTVLQWREKKGMNMRDPDDEIFYPGKGVQVIQLERKGSTIIMRIAKPGKPMVLVGAHVMKDIPEEVFAGLFICSHSPDATEEVRVWNVKIKQ